jgi:hypothetical protein
LPTRSKVTDIGMLVSSQFPVVSAVSNWQLATGNYFIFTYSSGTSVKPQVLS